MTSVPTGIDLERFKPRDKAAARRQLRLADRPTLGILATLRDWKGHDYLLEAYAMLRKDFPEWRLLIIGDGPWRPRLDERMQALALGDSVTFVGNQADAPAWLNALDLFALPSFGDEGVPQAIMQAMACGLAVVSTPVGGIPEAVSRDETGLLVPPRDAAALASALARLMSDPDLRSHMGAVGRERALARFGIDIMLDRMENIFRRFGSRA
jgi:glycosyltransferase involved in cell wall biosynthesis